MGEPARGEGPARLFTPPVRGGEDRHREVAAHIVSETHLAHRPAGICAGAPRARRPRPPFSG
jgi:hypothetical protein